MHDVKESAKQVRRILKATYPGMKFSVRIKRYSGGSSVSIFWTDGPAEVGVRDLTVNLKGWHNGYYNDHIGTARHISVEMMTAAAKSAAEFYKVPTPKVIDAGDYAYLEDMTMLSGGTWAETEPLCDKVHRAARKTSAYAVSLDTVFDSMWRS